MQASGEGGGGCFYAGGRGERGLEAADMALNQPLTTVLAEGLLCSLYLA
jgi:hypothetical protein